MLNEYFFQVCLATANYPGIPLQTNFLINGSTSTGFETINKAAMDAQRGNNNSSLKSTLSLSLIIIKLKSFFVCLITGTSSWIWKKICFCIAQFLSSKCNAVGEPISPLKNIMGAKSWSENSYCIKRATTAHEVLCSILRSSKMLLGFSTRNLSAWPRWSLTSGPVDGNRLSHYYTAVVWGYYSYTSA